MALRRLSKIVSNGGEICIRKNTEKAWREEDEEESLCPPVSSLLCLSLFSLLFTFFPTKFLEIRKRLEILPRGLLDGQISLLILEESPRGSSPWLILENKGYDNSKFPFWMQLAVWSQLSSDVIEISWGNSVVMT